MSAGYGIYVHVPFCARKCPYCDFYSQAFDKEMTARYIDALCNQTAGFGRRAAATVYFGGGTPSLLFAADVARVLDAVARRFDLAADAEITLELNPETASIQKLRDLRAAGVNRLSVGVQSTDPATLHAAGRRHTAAQALDALDTARAAGFDNISADVMIGLPGDSEETLGQTLRTLAQRPVTHLSAYLLKLMPGTPFGEAPPAGIPDDDSQAALYEYTVDLLRDQGFAQYEISNFAKPGFESRHNLLYWNLDDYIGMGPAAHSSLEGKRYSFPPDLDAFLRCFAHASTDWRQGLEAEGDVTAADYIMLQLRLNSGLSLRKLYDEYKYELNIQERGLLTQFERAGLLTFEDDTARLSTRGMLVSNSIIAALI